MDIELSDLEAENTMLKGDYMSKVVEIVIGGVPTVPEVGFMCLFMSLGRILLPGSISRSLFSPLRHPMDLGKVEVGILLLGDIYLVAGIISPVVHVAPLLGLCPI